MIKSLLAVAVVAVLSVSPSMAQQGPKNRGAPSGVFEFVGFTDETTNTAADTINGAQGMLAMHALCKDDFGPDSRMCTGREFWLSPNAAPPSSGAWYHSARSGENVDFSGVTNPNVNCGGWNIINGSGNVVTAGGTAAQPSCSILHAVTCCAPLN